MRLHKTYIKAIFSSHAICKFNCITVNKRINAFYLPSANFKMKTSVHTKLPSHWFLLSGAGVPYETTGFRRAGKELWGRNQGRGAWPCDPWPKAWHWPCAAPAVAAEPVGAHWSSAGRGDAQNGSYRARTRRWDTYKQISWFKNL